jgi:hypothetical protein
LRRLQIGRLVVGAAKLSRFAAYPFLGSRVIAHKNCCS